MVHNKAKRFYSLKIGRQIILNDKTRKLSRVYEKCMINIQKNMIVYS